jgi:hypothetical protein
MANQFELILIFVAVLTGVISAAYFYLSSDIFMVLLKRPLKLISTGMFVIAIGVLLAAFISFEAEQGIVLALYGVPLSAYFYILYIIGSLFIAFGARQFTHRSKPSGAVM